jgi:isopropylmalate/homocitrate/citramalate synthase
LNEPVVRGDKPRIYLIDVTNRDGVQTAKIGLSKLQKTMINHYLDEMGIFQSEFGFPALEHETNYINANLKLHEKGFFKNIRLEGWVRATPEDVYKALQLTKVEHLNLSISTSLIMTHGKFGGRMSREDVLKMMTEAVDAARQAGVKSIGVNAEDASRTAAEREDGGYDEDYLLKFALAAKKHGADRIRYCDTLGYDRTQSIYDTVHMLAKEVQLPIELHCHNDTGFAVANSVEGAMGAIDAGVDAYVNVTVNGMGERAGNADLVSVILAITKSRGLRNLDILDPKIDLTKAWKIANYVARSFQVPIPINQVGVGANAFAHESGIHADGVLKNRKNYEIYSPEELGIPSELTLESGRIITTGEYGGIKGMRHVYSKMGVELPADLERRILHLVQIATMHNQQPLVEDELKFIAEYPEEAALLMTVIP